MSTPSITIIGLGYIGLPTAAAFAARGHAVHGVDVNPRVVDTVNRGEIHIIEPDLDQVVRKAVQDGLLKASTTPVPADAFLIAVPTPFKDGHVPDIDYVESAARSIAPVLRKGNLVVLESTSPVGTTEKMRDWLAEMRPDLRFPHPGVDAPDVHIAYCPERVLPGRVLIELVKNDRVVGGLTRRCSERAQAIYQLFVEGECVLTDARTAEMCKLTENSFRDVNIAFANELSLICERLGINVWELIALANRHPRVKILQPGAGVGGHCIAVDPWFIVDAAPEQSRLIRTAREVNDGKPHHVLDQVAAAARKATQMPARIACLGLAFKPDIDDLRESPALEIATAIAQMPNVEVMVVEPHIDALPAALTARPNVTLCRLDDALARAEIAVCLVQHRQFVEHRALLARFARPMLIDPVGLARD